VKKNFLLRIDKEIFDEVDYISEIEDRSINYMLCKLINKGLNSIDLDSNIEKEIEEYSSKTNSSKTQLIEAMWKMYRKTFK
jgi:DNA helicase HerA-like ATPase